MPSVITLPRPSRLEPHLLINFRLILLLVTVLAIFGLSGCRTAMVREYQNQPVPPGLKIGDVGKAIHNAGNSLGWAMEQKHEGLIVGTLYIRTHMAKVEIPYSSTSYSIIYKDSTNLKYDAENKTIHSNYDGWIQNLNNQIRSRLYSR